jgi:small nuclear ribonucleoprotein G
LKYFIRENNLIVYSGKANPPELKKFMDKRCQLKLNGNRTVVGVLRGFDPFMNLVIDEAYEALKNGEKRPIGMVVARGNSITMIEALERLG